jgi:hypothetical protein
MRFRGFRKALAGAVLAGTALLVSTSVGRADPLTVNQGYDLLITLPGTKYLGVPMTGVPLNTFDFGSGPVSVGAQTDTIVHRLADASATPGGTATIPIEIAALQLVTTAPTTFAGNLPLAIYYATLQSARGGPASTGSMDITFDPSSTPTDQFGTFSSFFDIFFDLRVGSPMGQIVFSNTDPKHFVTTGAKWTHIAPQPGTFLIDGVNNKLNGQSNQNDFFPLGSVMHVAPDAMHIVSVPEPASFVMTGLGGLICFAGYSRQRRRIALAAK